MRPWPRLMFAALCSLPMLAAAAVAVPVAAAALDHVAIYVQDAERSAAFYKAVFGLTQVKASVPRAIWLVMSNGTMLHIIPGRTAPTEHPKFEHLALACSDMPAMIARLKVLGVPWAAMDGQPTPQVRADGVQQIFIKDPDGYWVEINDALRPR